MKANTNYVCTPQQDGGFDLFEYYDCSGSDIICDIVINLRPEHSPTADGWKMQNKMQKKSRLLLELIASLIGAIATRSSPGSHNMIDLMQSLVPTLSVCN